MSPAEFRAVESLKHLKPLATICKHLAWASGSRSLVPALACLVCVLRAGHFTLAATSPSWRPEAPGNVAQNIRELRRACDTRRD